MPRPLKDPSVRQRTNRAPTRATLYTLRPDQIQIPTLPTCYDDDGNEKLWSLHTQRWWEAVWSSPMVPEFYESDIEGLYRLAALVEAFWQRPSAEKNSEIRMYEKEFGLNPMARRRLEWQIVDTTKAQEQAEDRAEAKRARGSRPPAQDDPGIDPLSA